MKCPVCSHENADNTSFCSACGKSLGEQSKDWNGIVLLAYCGSLIFFALAYFVVNNIFKATQAGDTVVGYVHSLMGIAQALTALVIPFGIRRMSLRAAAFVFIAVYVIFCVYLNVQTIMELSNA